MTFVTLLAQAQNQPSPSTIIQGIMVGMLIIFVFSVGSTLFITKKINNISQPSFGRALVATILKNVFFLPTLLVGLTLEGMPILGALAIAVIVVPVVVYKIVYGCMWREALVVWLVVFVVEVAVSYGLTLAGMMSLEAFT